MSVAVASGVISIEQVQEIQLRVRIKDVTSRLDHVEADAAAAAADPNRSPSPPPVYDSAGNRINTRTMRMRHVLESERNELVEEILSLNPLLRVNPFDFCHLEIASQLQISAQNLHSAGQISHLQLRRPNPGSPREIASQIGERHPYEDHYSRPRFFPRRKRVVRRHRSR